MKHVNAVVCVAGCVLGNGKSVCKLLEMVAVGCIKTHLALFRVTQLTACNHNVVVTICKRQSQLFAVF